MNPNLPNLPIPELSTENMGTNFRRYRYFVSCVVDYADEDGMITRTENFVIDIPRLLHCVEQIRRIEYSVSMERGPRVVSITITNYQLMAIVNPEGSEIPGE